MTRLTDHLEATAGVKPTEANPLPTSIVEGDSADAEIWDHDDTPPGVDRRSGIDHRTPQEKARWDQLVAEYGDDIPYEMLREFERSRS